jgi:hypothetical protein
MRNSSRSNYLFSLQPDRDEVSPCDALRGFVPIQVHQTE